MYATRGSAEFLKKHGVASTVLNWPDSGLKPNVMDYLRDGKIDLVVNIPKDLTLTELNNDYSIRRTAIDLNIPLLTNARLASAYIKAISNYLLDSLPIKHMGAYKVYM